MFIVIGPGVWGKGETEDLAVKHARQEYGRRAIPKYYVTEVGDPDAVVDGGGGILYRTETADGSKTFARPATVAVVEKGKRVPLAGRLIVAVEDVLKAYEHEQDLNAVHGGRVVPAPLAAAFDALRQALVHTDRL